MADKPTIHWRTEWANGTPTHFIMFSDTSAEQRSDIERAADNEGFRREGEHWSPTEGPKLHGFFEVARAKGFDLDFEKEDEDALFDLQRLKLERETRKKLETLQDFTLGELAGWCPVQAEGQLDGQFWYFRARGAYWRFELGGNESRTKGPKWWHEEDWPGKTGFEAGYMSDEDAITSILKSVNAYRTENRSRFERGHPEYERTTLEGWAIGALSLQRAIRRLGISGQDALDRATAYGIELPYLADRELKSLGSAQSTVLGLDRASGKWVELRDEDD
ncbi:hypothetical protein N2599_11310 [Rhizobium sullae]|uniref:Uncharacterized protein n=1 Tax=Rhizobium sullae TaxID=50338 RepID=A0ABY5XE03_RHISU|nr:hypothetical protein [Rhizobium sullae]UWU12767.1 hypothetical protein N2599_11310 [Rhizobium sullae]